ncbi:ATP-binding protein [Mesorhizobium sp. IMUNJ 23232]|uniref:ATP-binding protein n=1 Tax=Mesorhizobium sp. IMUNJ 23232 TaxID=3376064 RepID=UPI0037AC0FF1
MAQIEARVFESRGWEVDLAKRELRARGQAVPIGSRAFEIIEALVQAAGELVTKEELMRRVWPGLVVEDNTVQVHIAAIRKALGEDRGLLKTISGRGYRLLGDWTTRQEIVADQPSPPESPERTRPAAHPFRTNVPVAASALVGRETSVQQLLDLVSAYRVVTLTGPGGIGKTVLASEVARRHFPALQGDVLFVELVSLSDPDLVPLTIAHALNLNLHGDAVSAQSVARAIGDKRTMLVLDNCEHVIDAVAAAVEVLVGQCPHVCVLATSRELLRIEGEFAYRVPALEVPAHDAEDVDDVLEHSAVQLFVARTRSLRADFQPEGDKLPAIAAICRHLDGIPLAIEFAAARAATLGIQQVAGRLDDRFALLTSGRRTALPRHQTLRATLDWSYELLPEPERRLLRHLAVFPAGFTLEAATAVMGGAESSVALDISSLVLKSLVALDGSEVAPRWRLLETVRVYSYEKLVAGGEEGRALRRLSAFCLSLFAPFASETALQSAIDDLGRYIREVDNLRAALAWALSPAGEPSLGIDLAATVTDFWIAASLATECCDWAEKALLRSGGAGTRSEMILQCGLGIALIYTQGMSRHAREVLMQTLDLARRLDDAEYQQRATCGLWLFSARSMALKDALAFARDFEEATRGDNLQRQATAAWLRGVPQTYLGQHAQANESLSWAIEHYPVASRRRDMIRLGGDPRSSSLAHRTVSLLSQGFLDAASRESKDAVDEARDTGQPTLLCVALAWAAGFVSLSLGELEQARDYGEELVATAYKHALRPFYAAGLCVRGSLAAKTGRPEAGVDPLRSGLMEMKEAKYLLFYPFFRTELAIALGAMGRIDESLHEIDEALQFARETDYRWYQPEMLKTKAELLERGRVRDLNEIELLYRQSMREAGEQQALFWELSAGIGLAEFVIRQERAGEADRIVSPIYRRLTEGYYAAPVKRAEALLHGLSQSIGDG